MAETTGNKAPEKRYSFSVEGLNVANMSRRFLDAFASILKNTNYRHMLDLYARSDMKCGRCASMCQVYKATGEDRDNPYYRTERLLKIYRRYFTLNGVPKTGWSFPFELRDPDIDAFVESVYRCTMCRRCTLECPAGVDHALTTHIGRYILAEIGILPKAIRLAARKQVEGQFKNILGMPLAGLKDTVEFLEEDLEEMTGQKIPIPIGKSGVDYVFFPPVTDFMTEAETIMGHAAVMYAMGLGDNWSLGDIAYDAKNYGYYFSDWVMERIGKDHVEQTKKLGGKVILIGECGHATRATRLAAPMFGGKNPPKVMNSIELLYQGVKEGKIKLKPDFIKEKVTYHDPCNIGRNSGIIEEPRYIIRQFVQNFVELKPHGAMNFCCGAGPASIDEVKQTRMEVTGKMKAEQLKASGADIVIAPCANCKKQISDLIAHYELPMERKGLHELVLQAMVWE